MKKLILVILILAGSVRAESQANNIQNAVNCSNNDESGVSTILENSQNRILVESKFKNGDTFLIASDKIEFYDVINLRIKKKHQVLLDLVLPLNALKATSNIPNDTTAHVLVGQVSCFVEIKLLAQEIIP